MLSCEKGLFLLKNKVPKKLSVASHWMFSSNLDDCFDGNVIDETAVSLSG